MAFGKGIEDFYESGVVQNDVGWEIEYDKR